jgi:hypothetical protein
MERMKTVLLLCTMRRTLKGFAGIQRYGKPLSFNTANSFFLAAAEGCLLGVEA